MPRPHRQIIQLSEMEATAVDMAHVPDERTGSSNRDLLNQMSEPVHRHERQGHPSSCCMGRLIGFRRQVELAIIIGRPSDGTVGWMSSIHAAVIPYWLDCQSRHAPISIMTKGRDSSA